MRFRKVGYGLFNFRSLREAFEKARSGDQLSVATAHVSEGRTLVLPKSLSLVPRAPGEPVVLRDPIEVSAGARLQMQDVTLCARITLHPQARLELLRCRVEVTGDALVLHKDAHAVLEQVQGLGVIRSHGDSQRATLEMRQCRWRGSGGAGLVLHSTEFDAQDVHLEGGHEALVLHASRARVKQLRGSGVIRASGDTRAGVLHLREVGWCGLDGLGLVLHNTPLDAQDLRLEGAGVSLGGSGGALLSGLRIHAPDKVAFRLSGQVVAHLQGVEVVGAQDDVFVVQDDTRLVASNCRVVGTAKSALFASDNAQVQFDGFDLQGGGADFPSVVAVQGARLLLRNGRVADTQSNGLLLLGDSVTEANNVSILATTSSAVEAQDRARLQLWDCSLLNGGRWGVRAKGHSQIKAVECRLTGHRMGRARRDPAAVIELERCDLRDDAALAAARQELDALVGLRSVKKAVGRLIDLLEAERRRALLGDGDQAIALNLVFTGNPGTGKTTVARIVGKVLSALGLLESGHLVATNRGGLVGEHMGETARKTRKLIDAAKDGVLFIDEAHTLSGGGENGCDDEAMLALLKEMKVNSDRLAVIVAGDGERMQGFFDANPGLASRFTRCVHFDGYAADELEQSFVKMASAQSFRLNEQARAALGAVVQGLLSRRDDSFSHARVMRRLFESTIEQQAMRIGEDGAAPVDGIDAKDVERAAAG